MKKLFLAVLICAVTAFGLIGCGKQTSSASPSGHEHPKSEHPK